MNREMFSDGTLRAAGRRSRFPASAVRAVLDAQRLLGLVFGSEIAERRASEDPVQRSFGEAGEAKLNDVLLRGFQEVAAILGEYLDKVHQSRRPHFSPELRYRILRVQSLLGMSRRDVAKLFRLSPTTIARSHAEATREPERNTIGSLLQPTPPIRRFADVVRRLVHSIAVSGFGGNQRIAETLARAGWKLSRETVRRIRNEKPFSEPLSSSSSSSRTVTAQFPNHVWMIDVTEIPSWFRLFTFKLVVVFDVFSRYPLVCRTFWLEPSSCDIRLLLGRAIRRVGAPRHLITDQGAQSTARSLRRWLRKRNIHHRFGAIGRTGSIALIERFWKTVKELLGLPYRRSLLKSELDRRIVSVLAYYARLKPHHCLEGNTPAECFFGIRALPLVDRPPPRARPGEPTELAPFRIAHFHAEPRLTYLVPLAA